MSVRKIGDFYQTALVTGPRHNFLAITVRSAEAGVAPSVEELPAVDVPGHGALDREAVLRAVQEGVDRANREFGTRYRVAAIRYVANDTPPEDIYSTLAYRIIAYIVGEADGHPPRFSA